MTRDRLNVEKGLKAKGFRLEEGDHHFFTYFSEAGVKTPVYTKTSHGMREVGVALLGRMAGDCRLSKKEFLRLVDCPLTREAYEALLTAGGHI